VREPPEILTYPPGDGWAAGAAESIARICHAAIERKGEALIALSGGATPEPVFDLLATRGTDRGIDWSRVRIAFTDERAVPPDDPESNYGMVRRRLLVPARVPEGNVLRIRGEEHPAVAAGRYAAALRSLTGRDVPVFDGIVLGVGTDGHTASLFPGSEVLHEAVLPVRAVFVPDRARWRITLTLPCINAAAQVVFLAAGEGKAAVVHRVIDDPPDIPRCPATGVSPARPHVQWVLDTGAASLLGPHAVGLRL
jgi:6-phosphogluconolactonase